MRTCNSCYSICYISSFRFASSYLLILFAFVRLIETNSLLISLILSACYSLNWLLYSVHFATYCFPVPNYWWIFWTSGNRNEELLFHTRESGVLRVRNERSLHQPHPQSLLSMDFPANPPEPIHDFQASACDELYTTLYLLCKIALHCWLFNFYSLV